MAKKDRAAFVLGLEEMEVRETTNDRPEQGYVTVDIAYCGVCGSDVHFYKDGEDGFRDVYPYILGHEAAGIVSEIGEGVTDLKVGDRVAIEPGITCGKCEQCKSGKYNLCPHVKFLSAPRYLGAMRQKVNHPAELCFKLPENVSLLSGALIEPLAVGIHGARQAEAGPGKTAVILGSGCIGLVTLLASKLYSVDRTIVVDIHDIRLKKAKELGADYVVNSTEEDVIERVMELTNGEGAEIVFETAGSPITTSLTGKLAKRGGTITLIGNTVQDTVYNFLEIMNKEITIKSVFRYRNIYPIAIGALASGQVNIEQIVSSIFDLSDAKKAFNTALYEKETNVKVVVKIAE